jgi:hypothetical protein
LLTFDSFSSGERIARNIWTLLILWLQAGQEWARRQEANDLTKLESKEKKAAAVEKKKQ